MYTMLNEDQPENGIIQDKIHAVNYTDCQLFATVALRIYL